MASYSQKIQGIRFQDDVIIVQLSMGEVSKPLSFLSDKLFNASKEDRVFFKISASGYGAQWPKLDEDISIAAFLGK